MSKEKLEIHVGSGLDADSLLTALRDHHYELKGFLIDNLEHLSMRAECDSFTLDEVQKERRRGCWSLQYTFGWSAYYGCRDMNDGGTEIEEFSFRYWGGVVKFEKDVIPRRDTHDEF